MTWSVYALPPGKGRRSWRLEARPPGGKGKSLWKRAETEDEGEARERAALWQEELQALVGRLVIERDPTVGAVMARRIAEGFACQGTTTSVLVCLRRVERVGLGAVRASQLGRAQVLLAQDELAALPLSAGSVNLTLSRAQSAWRWAHERELVSVPWPAVRRLRVRRTAKRPYTDGEVVQVLEWIRDHRRAWYPLFLVLSEAGCRPGELVAVVGADVHREECEITLRHTKTRVVRRVAIAPETMALVPRAATDSLVWRGQRGPLKAQSVYDRLQVVLKALGLDGEDLDVASESGRPRGPRLRAGGP